MTSTKTPTRLRQLADRLDTDGAFRVMLWVFGATLLVYATIPVINAFLPGESIKDYKVWFDTGQHVLRGEPIYPGPFRKFPFMYPPSCALFLAPLSLLGRTGIIVALVLMNAAAWPACILLSVRLATGDWKRQHLLLYIIPSGIISVYAWSNFHLGQPSLVLLALVLGGFVALQRRWQITAGALIAFAAAIKAFPVLASIYLIYRRNWTAAAALVVTLALLLIVLPTPFRGLQQAREDLRLWTHGMLFKYDETGMAQRPGRSNSWKNQSIFGVANRLLRHIEYDFQFGPHTLVYTNVADLSFRTVNRILVAAALLSGLAYVVAIPKQGRRTSETDALEFACLLLLILMFTPLAFDYLFAFLLFPFTVIVQRWLAGGSRRLLIFAVIAMLLLATSIPLQRPAQALGNAFFAAALLFIALALELVAIKRREVSDLAPP
ncbi:MAG: DUF2029 domain-containing protein [Chthoniobacterales bacterium]|nr:DUF2029 domain-containing protein [Chthoniobacterales bacterium]